ncbi:hypothetical protein [Amycolatopsis sp. cmx-8-4]|uniref:hypothetical protein n=1 Tax=Amycolatopsis sp. cmx-8-4 TaxID=2790947 RepID=UPI00397DCB9E
MISRSSTWPAAELDRLPGAILGGPFVIDCWRSRTAGSVAPKPCGASVTTTTAEVVGMVETTR